MLDGHDCGVGRLGQTAMLIRVFEHGSGREMCSQNRRSPKYSFYNDRGKATLLVLVLSPQPPNLDTQRPDLKSE